MPRFDALNEHYFKEGVASGAYAAEGPEGISAEEQNQYDLAMMAMEANATGAGIDDAECLKLKDGVLPDVYVSPEQCKVLREVLGTGRDAIVTDDEEKRLQAAGFHPYFIAVITGPGGKNPLQVRRGEVAKLVFFHDIAAIEELASMGPDAKDERGQVVEILRDKAKSPTKGVKLACIRALGAIIADDKETIRLLKSLKKDSDKDVKSAAKEALARIKAGELPPEEPEPPMEFTPKEAIDPLGGHTVPELLAALDDPDADVRKKADSELSAISNRKLVKKLIAALAHKDAPVRAQAARRLGMTKAKGKAAKRALKKAAKDTEPKVRAAAIKALALLGDASLAADMAGALRPPEDIRVRLAAAEAIAELGPLAEAAVPVLVTMLEGDSANDSRIAASLLGNIGDGAKPAIPALVRATGSSDRRTANNAQYALRLTGPADSKQAKDIAALIADQNFTVYFSAIEALTKMGPAASKAKPTLIEFLENGSAQAKKGAAYVLGSMGAAASIALPALAKLADVADEYKVRMEAYKAIKKIDPDYEIAEPTGPAPAPKPQPSANPPAASGKQIDRGNHIVREIRALVNQARSQGRTCGDKPFPPAPELLWNNQLAQAALNHSIDMATNEYFNHTGRDGSKVDNRARAAGYNWIKIGENIGLGYMSVERAVQRWLASPGHCANIMDPDYTEIGVAYSWGGEDTASYYYSSSSDKSRPYWTMVLGDK